MEKTNTKKTYFSFLLQNAIKKKSLWIISGLYILIFCVFIYVVPGLMRQSPFYVWSNPILSIQTMMIYISCIFASLLVITIYKNFRDDGTELLIVCKPISRKAILFIKMCVFAIISFTLAVTIALFSLFIFCFNVSTKQAFSLLGSSFLITIISLILFGGIALIVSIFANKVWIIISGILLIVVSNVYYIVFKYAEVVKTPTDKMLSENSASITTINSLNSDLKTYTQSASMVSKEQLTKWATNLLNFDDPDDILANPLGVLNETIDHYNHLKNKSKANIINYFDTNSLLHQMGNGFALENKAIDFSNKAFGADSSMDYTINGSTIVDKFSDNSKTYPLMLLDYNGMSYFNPEDYDSELQLLYGIYDYVITKNAYQFALMNNTIISMGTSVTQTSGMSAIAMAQSTDDNYVFVIKKPTHSGFFCYDANFINFTETEKKIFDTLLSSESEIYFKRYDKKEAEYYLPKGLIPANCEDIPEESKPFINHGIDEKTKKEKFINDDASNANSFNFKSSTFTPVNKTTGDPIESFDSFYQYVHFCLTNQISTDGETWYGINAKTNDELTLESLKFKYYIMTEKYRPLQEKYINPYLNAFSNDHSHIYNDQNLGPVFMPFDYSDSSGTAEITQSPLFFDPEFIAVNTLAKNYSVGNKSVGFAGRTYSGDDGNQYLDPTDYRMYTQSSYANIARNIYPVATTMFFSFDYTTTLEIPTWMIYVISTILAILIYGTGYVFYTKIDFK